MSAVLDRETFDRLVLEHLPAAQGFAIRLTGSRSAAEDLMQEAMLKAHRGWRSFRGQSKFRTWFFQIIVNCFRDDLKRRERRSGDESLTAGGEIACERDPARDAEARELGEMVAAEISQLPPRQREVLVLIAYEQLTPTDAADVLGVSEQNVRTNLHLARQRLRRRLSRYLKLSNGGVS